MHNLWPAHSSLSSARQARASCRFRARLASHRRAIIDFEPRVPTGVAAADAEAMHGCGHTVSKAAREARGRRPKLGLAALIASRSGTRKKLRGHTAVGKGVTSRERRGCRQRIFCVCSGDAPVSQPCTFSTESCAPPNELGTAGFAPLAAVSCVWVWGCCAGVLAVLVQLVWLCH
jgi:hypothetical protein